MHAGPAALTVRFSAGSAARSSQLGSRCYRRLRSWTGHILAPAPIGTMRVVLSVASVSAIASASVVARALVGRSCGVCATAGVPKLPLCFPALVVNEIRECLSWGQASPQPGHTAAPPSSVMKSRRFTAQCLPCFAPKGSHASHRKDSTSRYGRSPLRSGISTRLMTAWGHERPKRDVRVESV